MKEMEKLEKELDNKMRSSALPDAWNPEEEGEEIMAQLIDIRPEPDAWVAQDETPKNLYIVSPLGEEGELRLPSHNILRSLLESQNPRVGDFLKIRFDGRGEKTSRGRAPYRYSLGVTSKEKAKEIIGEDQIKDISGETVREASSSLQPSRKESRRVKEEIENGDDVPSKAPGEIKDDGEENLAEYVKELMDFYESGMKIDEFDEYLNQARDFDIEPEKAAKLTGLKIEDGKVYSS